MAQAGQDNLRNAFRLLAGGQMAALETIWQESARPLHGYAFALTADVDEADDILSDVVARLLRSRWRLRWVRNPKAYLFAAVRNSARDRAARRARAEPLGPESRHEPAVPGPAEAAAIRAAVMGLPDDQREVVVLHIWGGLTFGEIGRTTGVSPSTATSRYRYGLEKLRGALGGSDDG